MSSLQSLVELEGPLGFRYAADLLRQVAVELAALHGQGRVHGSVTPFRILLGPTGRAELEEPPLELTPDSVDYLSTEMALNGRAVDHRADIYSAGCVFHLTLTGRPPFGEGTLSERLLHHQVTIPDRVSLLRPSVPVELDDLCVWMLQKEPNQRPEVDDVLGKLAEWLLNASE